MQRGLKCTGINLQSLQDKELVALLKKNLTGGISLPMRKLYEKVNEKEKILTIDAESLYMGQLLPYDGMKSDENVEKEDTPDDSDTGHFTECDLPYKENMKKTKSFPFGLENKVFPQDNASG